ncbi:hypothetical protein D3C71_729190 [compost metagenome]
MGWHWRDQTDSASEGAKAPTDKRHNHSGGFPDLVPETGIEATTSRLDSKSTIT